MRIQCSYYTGGGRIKQSSTQTAPDLSELDATNDVPTYWYIDQLVKSLKIWMTTAGPEIIASLLVKFSSAERAFEGLVLKRVTRPLVSTEV